MTHASLFSGIGGFDLAAEWAGWTNAFNCEIDPFCRRVLKYHFPNAAQYEDIRTTDFTIWRGRIDVLTGGFPCQPFSIAGKRKGTEDKRHLWPEMLRAIRDIRPRWVVGENVLGIVNWSDGMVFEQVHLDLEAEGYEVLAFVLPACGVDAPHKRYRTWFVAYAENAERIRCNGEKPEEESEAGGFRESCAGNNVRLHGEKGVVADGSDARFEAMRERQDGVHAFELVADTECLGGREVHDKIQSWRPKWPRINCVGYERNAPDADGERCDQCVLAEESGKQKVGPRKRDIERTIPIPDWQGFPTESPVCGRNDGVPARLDGITFPAWCRESIKAYGNAIVPQAALQILEAIKEYTLISSAALRS